MNKGTTDVTPQGWIGFTGHRDLAPAWKPLVTDVVQSIMRAGRGIAVGDAPGLDAYVREVADRRAQVFRAASGAPEALAQRSAAMVDHVVATGEGAGLVGFVSRPCPTTIVPNTDSRRCWNGAGEGTWSSLAYGAAHGLTIILFWCDHSEPRLPAWLGGSWKPARSTGVWAQGKLFSPLVQTGLLDASELATLTSSVSAPPRRMDEPQRTRRARRR